MNIATLAMTRQLIVNADDYGLSPGVSRGIVQAHRAGIVTSTTVMINQPGIEAGLAEALAHPALGTGLHLVFTHGRPVLPAAEVPGLVDGRGRFLEQHELWAQAEEIPPAQLAAELAAQVARFEALSGRLPDHLDCHEWVYLYPAFFEVYAGLAARTGLALRVPFPVETDPARAAPTLPYLEGFPAGMVQSMIAANSRLLRSLRAPHPDHFVSTFYGREMLRFDLLVALLAGLPEGVSELMCHPGFAEAGDGYGAEREMELRLLTDPALRAELEAMGIEPVTYGALA